MRAWWTEEALMHFAPAVVERTRVAGITTVLAANRYLHQRFLATYDARFTHPTADPASTFVPLGQMDLTHISVTKKRPPSPWTIWSPSRACACRLTRRRAAAPAESLVHSSNSVYRVRVPDLWRRRLKRY